MEKNITFASIMSSIKIIIELLHEISVSFPKKKANDKFY